MFQVAQKHNVQIPDADAMPSATASLRMTSISCWLFTETCGMTTPSVSAAPRHLLSEGGFMAVFAAQKAPVMAPSLRELAGRRPD